MARRSSPQATTTPPGAGGVVQFPPSSDPPLLLRIPVGSATWAETLPPRPSGAVVTAAFSDADVEAEHADALALLGYASVGVRPPGRDPSPAVDLLIPRAACDRWPLWRDQLLNAGGRVWDLGFGPVAAMMAPAVAVHRPAPAR